jgi:uncharacterized protein GlcG (DUF336 family)
MFVTTTARLTHAGAKHRMATAQAQAAGIAVSVAIVVDGECVGGIGVRRGDWQTDARIAAAAVESIGAAT